MQCYAIPHHTIPYVPQVRWIICSFSSLSLAPCLSSIQSQCTYFFNIKTRAHFILFRSGGGFHFLFVFFCCRVFRLCWESCVFSPTSFSFILRACGCIQIWNRKSYTEIWRGQEEERKTMKLLENLLCESEWVCAFSIKFNKHTKWVQPKSSKGKSERDGEGIKNENNLIKFICFPIVRFHFSLLCF